MTKKELIGRFLLVGWIIVMLFGLAALSVKHIASLPEPSDEAFLSQAMLKLRRDSSQSFLVDVIYGECSCARALLAHLIARRPFPGAEEMILFVGADPNKQQLAERAGFAFVSVSAADLVSRFGLEAAPVLIAFDSAGRLRYMGGYYAHPAAIAPLDEKIYLQLIAGASVEPLPIFGCAVSSRLQKSFDPLSFLSSKP